MMPNDDLQVIITPTFGWLAEFATSCKSQMLISSPYVNGGIINLTDRVSKDVPRTLITRTDLRDFALGASSLDTLCTLAQDGVTIKSLSNLHAKMYIFDNSALVTSANATFSGLHRNLECGLATKNEVVVKQLASSLLKGFGARRYPASIGLEELEGLRESVAAIKVSLPAGPIIPDGSERYVDGAPALEADFSISDDAALVQGLKGWKRLTLRGVLDMPEEGFHIVDLLAVCEPVAAGEYPRNNNVREKLRQQLQLLRDLGLVEFLGKGFYRRMMN